MTAQAEPAWEPAEASPAVGTYLTVSIELPQTVSDVAELLVKVSDIWPTAQVDTRDEAGWIIRVGAFQ